MNETLAWVFFIYYPTVFLVYVVWKRWKIKLHVLPLVLAYGLILAITNRWKRYSIFKQPAVSLKVRQTQPPDRITDYAAHYNLANNQVVLGFDKRKPIKINALSKHWLVGGTTGGGKAQPLWANVLTPTGFRPMGEIKQGDLVLGPYGAVWVTGVYPQGIEDVYCLTMANGVKVYASLGHRWLYKYAHNLQPESWREGTTKSLLKSLSKMVLLPINGLTCSMRVVSIEKHSTEPTQCIKVERELYYTDGHIVTHNTNELHSILIQLFSQGLEFFNNVDVFIFDMKGHEDDNLHLWRPLLAGYATRQGGSIQEALALLRRIDAMLSVKMTKKMFIIIDEVSILTADKEADGLLGNISSQVRLNGCLLLTVQHPQYQVVRTFVKHNLERRLCGVVLNSKQAETILEAKPRALPKRVGEYILREPGVPELISLTASPVSEQDILDTIDYVNNLLTTDDPRIKLYMDVTHNKRVGQPIPGIKQVKTGFEEVNNRQHYIMVAYRNFAEAGLFMKPTRQGGSYTLARADGLPDLVRYIKDGSWQDAPESIVGET